MELQITLLHFHVQFGISNWVLYLGILQAL